MNAALMYAVRKGRRRRRKDSAGGEEEVRIAREEEKGEEEGGKGAPGPSINRTGSYFSVQIILIPRYPMSVQRIISQEPLWNFKFAGQQQDSRFNILQLEDRLMMH